MLLSWSLVYNFPLIYLLLLITFIETSFFRFVKKRNTCTHKAPLEKRVTLSRTAYILSRTAYYIDVFKIHPAETDEHLRNIKSSYLNYHINMFWFFYLCSFQDEVLIIINCRILSLKEKNDLLCRVPLPTKGYPRFLAFS